MVDLLKEYYIVSNILEVTPTFQGFRKVREKNKEQGGIGFDDYRNLLLEI